MRAFYNLQPGDVLAQIWPTGCIWMRESSAGGQAVLVPEGVYMLPGFDTFVLSQTEAGVFILKDVERMGSLGVLRFERPSVTLVTPGSGSSPADVVELKVAGHTLNVQISRSARLALQA